MQNTVTTPNEIWKEKCLACNIVVAADVRSRHEQSLDHIMNNITKLCEKCDQELFIIQFENAENDDLCKNCKQKTRKKICRECKDLFVPPPLCTPRAECPKCNEESVFLKFDNIVYVDLETSDWAQYNPQILEIGALSNTSTFSRFCRPYLAICKDASKITGLRSKKGVLYKHGIPVSNTDPEENVLKDFVDWLPKTRFAFVAYNVKFDKTVLCRQMSRYGIRIDTPHRWFCAMNYVKMLEGRNITLKNALKKNGIEFQENNFHGAFYDAKCLKELFQVLMADNCIRYQTM